MFMDFDRRRTIRVIHVELFWLVSMKKNEEIMALNIWFMLIILQVFYPNLFFKSCQISLKT